MPYCSLSVSVMMFAGWCWETEEHVHLTWLLILLAVVEKISRESPEVRVGAVR